MGELRLLLLFYSCSFAGAFMVVGGIVLLYKQKIYIDRESKMITEIETPIGKFRTNLPALTLFALGFVPLIYPVWQLGRLPRTVQVTGRVTTKTEGVRVYVIAKDDDPMTDGSFSIPIPILPGAKPEPKEVIFTICDNTRVADRATAEPNADGDLEVQAQAFDETCPPRIHANK